MRHLSEETLARLVDEPAGPDEKEHLASCEACAAELEALREQTDALSSLPDLRPPPEEWDDLRERLVLEGLLRPETSASTTDGNLTPVRGTGGTGEPGRPRAPWIGAGGRGRPAWLQAAAALVLFLAGAGTGAAVTAGGESTPGDGADASATTSLASVASIDEVTEELQRAEERYMSALVRYRELAGSGEAETGVDDPASRYAALESVLEASRNAVRRAPTDPFLNGILVSTLAERQATLREFTTASADSWF